MHRHTYLDLCTQVSMHMQTHMDILSPYKNTHSQSFERSNTRHSIKGAGYHRIIEDPELEGTHMNHQVRISKIKSGGKESRRILEEFSTTAVLCQRSGNSGALQTEVAWGTG